MEDSTPEVEAPYVEDSTPLVEAYVEDPTPEVEAAGDVSGEVFSGLTSTLLVFKASEAGRLGDVEDVDD